MTSPEDRIKELARARAIGGEDVEQLLAAVRPSPVRATRNPFERWSGEVTSLVGLFVAAGGLATSRLGIRYDGALDLHYAGKPVPFGTALLDQFVAWVVTAAVLWGAARFVARHVRFVDMLGGVGASRLPAVIAAVPLAFLIPLIPRDPTKPNLAVLALVLVALAGAGLQIFLLVLGFRTASGLRGGRLAGTFIAALLGAEVITKTILAIALR